MAHDSTDAVVLVSEAGDYYVLTRETLEAARVAEGAKEELRALLEDDTTGHTLPEAPFALRQSFILAGGLSLLDARGIIVVGGRSGRPTAIR